MIIPFALFWVLLYIGREELGCKGIAVSLATWLGLLVGCGLLGFHGHVFTAMQALLDIVLLLIIFGGDINITMR